MCFLYPGIVTPQPLNPQSGCVGEIAAILTFKELARHPNQIVSWVCAPAQHHEMLDQVLKLFDTASEYGLDLMRSNQSIAAENAL